MLMSEKTQHNLDIPLIEISETGLPYKDSMVIVDNIIIEWRAIDGLVASRKMINLIDFVIK